MPLSVKCSGPSITRNKWKGGRNKAVQRIREKYNWDDVAVAYEKLFQAIKNGEHPWRSRGKICK